MSALSDHLWWQTGVIYQIYPRSFKDSTGNGVGDLAGIIQKLDYLSDTLGVDAIWLSPFYPSPMKDFGYDVADYTNVDPLFGDLETFDQLLTQAHRRGIRLIIDLVINHTSDQHPWFQESRKSRNSPKRDWYMWADAKPDGSPPNNWLSVFGGSAWAWDEDTRQYYLHSFLKEQPDLNWRNPQVKRAMFDVVRFWLDRGVDGFRIDVAQYIMKDPLLRDNPINPTPSPHGPRPLSEYDSQLHIHNKGHPDIHPVYREFRHVLDEYDGERPRMSIAETHIFDWAEWVRYYGEQLDELHMPFNFYLLYAEWNAQSVRAVVDTLEASLPAGAWPNYVLGNHDESRLASRIGRQQARVAAMLLLTLRGTPVLYYGDEIGMVDVPVSGKYLQDPAAIRGEGLGRDPCRTPMQWDNSPNAGCSPEDTVDMWLPLADDYTEVNVERQLTDSRSILNLYRRLLAYRKDNLVLQMGEYFPVDVDSESCFVYRRLAEGRPGLLVALNFTGKDQWLNLLSMRKGKLVISTHLDREGEVDLRELNLRPDEGVVIELG